MDIREETIGILKHYYKYKKKKIKKSDYIKLLCDYFDKIKYDKNVEDYYDILTMLANDVGIPQYVTMLSNFQKKKILPKDINLNVISSILNEAKLSIHDDIMLHQFQYDFLRKFNRSSSLNRYILSAPTSFGKTFLVYEIIKKMKYNNIVLIFPTISLLSENYDRIMTNNEYKYIRDNYSIHTLSNNRKVKDRNIWIFTPERYMSYVDKNNNQKFDFVFIDEIYKIDNEFIINEGEIAENERDTAFRLALAYSCENSNDLLLVGPYIKLNNIPNSKNLSFNNFVKENNFEVIDYNEYEIVNKELLNIKGKKYYTIDGKEFNFENITSKYDKLEKILISIKMNNENAIIYCRTKAECEKYAKMFVQKYLEPSSTKEKNKVYEDFLEHIKEKFGEEWIVYKALVSKIGIHHGLVPKYIQKQIIEFFNEGLLQYIFSTTTITEGVNTSAKNIVITSSKKGNKELKHFDAQNIAGRAGRFTRHYKGNVIILQNSFEKILKEEGEEIKHKNYDSVPKNEIDYYMTNEKYLSIADKEKILELKKQQEIRNIPDKVMKQFKIIGYTDKFRIYDEIKDGKYDEAIRNFIMSINNSKMTFNWSDFETIMSIILPIIPQNTKLYKMANLKVECINNKHISLLTIKLYNYIKYGYYSLVDYQVKRRKLSVDEAIRDTSDFVYNILKYQLVKYLGVLDLMYRYVKSLNMKIDMDDVSGINKFLQILEYNALSDTARLVSDYGSPFNVVKSFEENSENIQKSFDKYEIYIREKVEKILQNGNIN